jgi:L-threonylcarbamoyladenylate synthase
MSGRFEAAAIRQLRQGRVLVHATEGVFGLACRANRADACARIAALKGRNTNKRFIVVVAAFAQISAVLDLANIDMERIVASWPGPETWIFPARWAAPRWLCGRDRTIAVRVTGHPQFARLCIAAGPLVSTSANLQGRRAAVDLLQARHYFHNAVDCYLAGDLLEPGRPSRIRNAHSGLALRS